MPEPSEPSAHRHQSNDDEDQANRDDELAERFVAHDEYLQKKPESATPAWAEPLDRYGLLLGGYRAPRELETPDEQRVEDERDRNPQLSLLELEYPAHDVDNQGVDRQPELGRASGRP